VVTRTSTKPSNPSTTPVTSVHIDGSGMTPAKLWSAARDLASLQPGVRGEVRIAAAQRASMERAHAFVARVASDGERVHYGINTGFGILAEVHVPSDQLARLQTNLIRSHACGVGEDLPRDVVAAMLLLRLNVAARGHSGLSLAATDSIAEFLRHGVIPCIPSRGSVGASGDLAPLAHAALPLIGEGACTIVRADGQLARVSGAEALSAIDRAPHALQPKEGLALINGTALTTALAVQAWWEARALVDLANLAATLTAVASASAMLDGSLLAFAAHGHPETLATARVMCALAEPTGGDDAMREALEPVRRTQDPYSLRCAPLVHGCVRHELEQCEVILEREINGSADNPLVFPDEGEIVSCGNFHALYPGRVSDRIASALVTLGTISERRTNFLMDGASTGLPTFLTDGPGLKSGLMMAHVTAAALASEAKTLAFPATVDSIPTNCDREDHVSMGPAAGFKALEIVWRIRHVLAIECIAAAQALTMTGLHVGRHRVAAVHRAIRAVVSELTDDRSVGPDIERLSNALGDGLLDAIIAEAKGG